MSLEVSTHQISASSELDSEFTVVATFSGIVSEGVGRRRVAKAALEMVHVNSYVKIYKNFG